MGYQLPPNLRALRDSIVNGSISRLETVAVNNPSPEDIQAVRTREERMQALVQRLSTPFVRYHHEPRTREVAQQPVQDPEPVAAY
jgi:hypothetical protein